MNHYERLKVSQDAPAEVIRAAYRALAAKLHPDRQNGTDGGSPGDGTHSQMAALNAAYEVLIDPKLRREYDATLQAPSQASGASFFGVAEPAQGGRPAMDPASTRVDMNWIPPGVASTAVPLWPPTRRMMLIGGSALAVLIVGTAGVMWQVMGQHQTEKVMSTQYKGQPPGTPTTSGQMPEMARTPADMPPMPSQTAEVSAVPPAPNGVRRPSVEELSRMSDEELLQVLPTLDEDSPVPQAVSSAQVAAARASGKHLLDGQPLGLRTELQLEDTLSTVPATKQPPARRP